MHSQLSFCARAKLAPLIVPLWRSASLCSMANTRVCLQPVWRSTTPRARTRAARSWLGSRCREEQVDETSTRPPRLRGPCLVQQDIQLTRETSGETTRVVFFFSSRRRHTRWNCDWSSDVCSSDLAKVISTATTVAEAVWLERGGVDAVIATGFEAGGHRGSFLTLDMASQPGTFALVPQDRKSVV